MLSYNKEKKRKEKEYFQMADPHLAIYNKLEDIDNTLNLLKEANDVEPVLNDISITLKNINESLAILLLRKENEFGDYMSELSSLTDKVNDLASDVNFISSDVNFIATS